jgi:hypothetical protein
MYIELKQLDPDNDLLKYVYVMPKKILFSRTYYDEFRKKFLHSYSKYSSTNLIDVAELNYGLALLNERQKVLKIQGKEVNIVDTNTVADKFQKYDSKFKKYSRS